MLARFKDLTVQHHLLKDVVHLLHVHDDVQLAHLLKVGVESFHQQVDEGVVGVLVLVKQLLR